MIAVERDSPHPEEWRLVPDTNGLYAVSNLGRIKSRNRLGTGSAAEEWRILKCSRDSKGYLFVRLHVLGLKPHSGKVHRLVASVFIRAPKDGEQVNHKNGIKTDNRVVNLEYVSCRQNIRHCWANGLYGVDHCLGEANQNAKLTRESVAIIREEYPGQSLSQLADRLGVTKQAVWQVVKGKTWVHV